MEILLAISSVLGILLVVVTIYKTYLEIRKVKKELQEHKEKSITKFRMLITSVKQQNTEIETLKKQISIEDIAARLKAEGLKQDADRRDR